MDLQPTIIFLQETFLKANDDIKIKNHENYNYIHNTSHRASGGVTILIRNDIPQSKISFNVEFQAISIKVNLYRTINICSLSVPPHDWLNKS